MDNQTANPNVLISERPAGTPARGWSFNPKWIFIILGIIIVIELILGLKYLSQPSQAPTPANQATKAKIALLSDKRDLKVGDTLTMKVEVSSPVPSDGVDVLAKFDPNILKAQDSDIQTGTLFSQYPLATIDPLGEIRISGITSLGKQGFSGVGVLATINFKAVKAGVTKVSLDFSKDSTVDSNIVSSQESYDLLEEVSDLEVRVK